MLHMKKTRKFFFCLGCAFLFVFSPGLINSQSVDTRELGAGGTDSMEFINYEGPYARIETLEQIRNIGASLGTSVNAGAVQGGGGNRYFIIHSVTPPEGDRLDADIFGLGVDVGVDHIRNLRLIIQGYLESAYRYSARDAALLGEYITIYTAVFRGNWGYFSGRYKNAALGHVDQEKAGLSIRFDEWPGRTHMLIPLTLAEGGSLSALDTSALSSPEVIDEMRSQDDMGLSSRKDMVDLKEREAAEAEERAAAQRQAADTEQQRINQEREQNQTEREQIAREREQAREDGATGRPVAREDTETGRTAAREQRSAEEQLAAREAAAEQKDEELNQREAAAAARRQEAEKNEELAERKGEEARQERQEIAQDQQILIAREEGQTPAARRQAQDPGFLGIRMIGTDSALGRLVRVNAATGAELRSGNLDTVNARSLTQAGNRLIAVAGENRGAGAIRLVEIDQENLGIARQGNDDIHPQSLIWQNGGGLYAIAVQDGKPYLGRFNNNLEKEAQSAIAVHPYGTPVFQEGMILIQRENGQVAILNGADLSEKR
ncbi:MAG: hypothetical protein LBT16_03675 [Treponema sp.]|jgi:hypothetical protein|nr:hypothetical protein [Treponema sp.]